MSRPTLFVFVLLTAFNSEMRYIHTTENPRETVSQSARETGRQRDRGETKRHVYRRVEEQRGAKERKKGQGEW